MNSAIPYTALHLFFFFFFNDTATTEIYTLSLHDALPISPKSPPPSCTTRPPARGSRARSEEHTSELQSRENLVCRLLLEKKKQTQIIGSLNSIASDVNKSLTQLLLH